MTCQAPKSVAALVRQVADRTNENSFPMTMTSNICDQVSLCSPRGDPSSIVDMYCDDEFALSLEFHPNMLLYPVQGVTSMEAELAKIDGN